MRTKSFRLPVLMLTLLLAFLPMVFAAPQQRETTLGILNQPPAFASGPSDNGSDGTTPTNVGVNVSFSATATDPNGDNYYVAVCKTAAITSNAGAAPTCDGGSWGNVSGATASESPVTPITYTTLVGDIESNAWYAYVCDGNGVGGSGDPDHQCSAVSNSESPFNVNHRPVIGTVTAGNAYGSNTSVDPGSGGSAFKISTSFSAGDDKAYSVATYHGGPNAGKIVVAGSSHNGADWDFAVARYNTDGSPDSTFDGDLAMPGYPGNGKVTTSTGSGYEEAFSVAIQSDGKIVAAGVSGNDYAIVRYDTDGSLDPDFGTGGIVTTDIDSSFDRIQSIAIQGNGKIVAAGWSDIGSPEVFSLARYNADGSLDGTFGTGGKVTTAIGANFAHAFSVAIQSTGEIVAAGYAPDGIFGTAFALVRYTAAGALDPSFDGDTDMPGYPGNGIVTTDFGDSTAQSIAIQGDGRIVAVGQDTGSWPNHIFAVARYNTDGSLDTAFDGDSGMPGYPGNGKVTTEIEGLSSFYTTAVALQSDGEIVVAGQGSNQFALVRYNSADGSLDTGFDTDGIVIASTTGSYGYGYATSVAIDTDGKIVEAGYAENGDDYTKDFALVRFTANGAVDSGVGNGSVFIRVGVTDPDTDTAPDTVDMYVCSDATTAFDPATATCTGGTLLCSATGVSSGGDADCTYADGAPVPTAHDDYPFKVYLRDSHGFGDDLTGNTHSYDVTDIAPTVDTYSVNDINPTAGGSVNTSFTVLVSDDNGYADIDTVDGLIYDTASGSGGTTLDGNGTCAPNEKNCYLRAACAKAQNSATQITATCDGIETFFNINPTAPGVWKAHVNAIDGGGTPRTVIGADSATSIAVGALSAVAVIQAGIAYGPIAVGGTSSSSETTTMQNVGNIQIDVGIHGSDMSDGSHSIPLAQQRWATDTGFSYGTGDHTLVADPETVPGNADQGCANQSVAVRATHASTATDSSIFWKLRIPDPQPTGSYAGSNTFTSVADISGTQCTGTD